jgi:hypothetical protein
MKYFIYSIFLLLFLLPSGCTSVKSVPMITMEEDQRLLELSKLRKDKKNKEKIVIGIPYLNDEEAEKCADDIIRYFEMTDYVKEINFTHLLDNNPDLLVTQILPHGESSFMQTFSMTFYILSLGVIPMYTSLEWGYDFNLKAVSGKEERKFTIGYETFGLSGWICLLTNWFPGMRPHHVDGQYHPFEIDCRMILQLQEKKREILNLHQDRNIP